MVKQLVFLVKSRPSAKMARMDGHERAHGDGAQDAAENIALAGLLLSAAATLVDGVHARVAAAGFDDLRPAHGFAFVRISAGSATVGDVAEHLGVTKQAASQLVDELVRKGYVTRAAHPTDARARLLALTPRGWACTRAADRAMAELMGQWSAVLGRRRLAALRQDLARVVTPGPLRPAVW
jgi:DNA-binding MarR family transcriptional regulator